MVFDGDDQEISLTVKRLQKASEDLIYLESNVFLVSVIMKT